MKTILGFVVAYGLVVVFLWASPMQAQAPNEVQALSEMVAQLTAKQAQQSQEIAKLTQVLVAQQVTTGAVRDRGKQFCKARGLDYSGYIPSTAQPFVCR